MLSRVKIDESLENGYSLDIGNLFSKAWNTFKEGAGLYIGLIFITLGITLFVSFIPIVGPLANTIFISPVLSLGYAILAYRIDKKIPYKFENAFDGFKKYWPVVLTYFIIIVAFFVLMIPIIFTIGVAAFFGGNTDSFSSILNFGITGLLFFLLIIYLAMSIRWATMLVYFYDYDAIAAITTSFKLVSKNIGINLLIILILISLVIGGVLALLIGVLIAAPLAILIDYYAFAEVTGLHHTEENMEIKHDLV